MKKLKDKIVFITGANSGIGRASAIEAANEGAIVIVADLEQVDHTETMKIITEISPKSIFIPIDVANEESVKNAISKTVNTFGRLDIALNNAGIGAPPTGIHDLTSKDWQRVIDINLTGNFYCVKHELEQFLKQGGGVIVNLASLAGIMPEATAPAYTASKHGVVGLTKNIAIQYGAKNIRANALCPAYVITPMTENAGEEFHKKWIAEVPMGRLGRPEEVAKAFIFFASEDSSYCNGTSLIIDGGRSLE